jgi:uncharacterized protein (TIGR02300 family)
MSDPEASYHTAGSLGKLFVLTSTRCLWQGKRLSSKSKRIMPVVKAELGTKRTCPSCAARFYDLLKNPVTCPKCGATFVAEVLLPSKGDGGAQPVAKPRPVIEPEVVPPPDVELVSLEEAEAPAEDETAAIEDVDLGEEVAVEGAEDDVFLEAEEEDGAAVPDIIGGPNDATEEET